MDSQETPINRDERRRSRRSRAAERVSSWFDEWVLIRGGDLAKGFFALLLLPFEGIAWAVRRYLLWPLQDRAGGIGAPGRVLAAVAAALLIGVGVAALLSASSSGGGGEPAAEEVAVAAEEPPVVTPPARPAPQPEGTLQGAAPVFEPTKEKKQAKAGGVEEIASAPAGADPATTRIGSVPGAASSSAAGAPGSTQSAVGIDGPPAGEKAIAVAEDFAGAFVLYETGGKVEKVRKAFAATATPELAKSLLKRPPRQPANVEVPEARVVNVVAGPSHGGVYSVSVSLLRVGLTSELRLDMEKHKDEWLVTNVLG
ncbi:MAG: hypothetical protein QOE75_2875 [Solirubrobacterales bacterium]|jgi:hypothetical protein|nr:hypothetical protein [Solirubrobacterales bacterium]